MRSEVLRRWRQIRGSNEPTGLRVALLGSFTMDTMVACLGTALADLGIKAEIFVGPFNRIAQECGDPESGTAAFKPDVLVVWPRLEDLWGNLAAPLADPQDVYLSPLWDIASLAEVGARRMGAQLVFTLPVIPAEQVLGMGDAANPLGTHAIAAAIRERVRAGFAGRPGALLYDAEEAVRTIGLRAALDRRLGTLAGLPYSAAMMEAAGAGLARVIGLVIRPARKAVVVDADNTLWGGAVGEVGADGLNFGPGQSAAYQDFQTLLLELRRAGVLLALCSKNTEADVWAAFERREMRLHREDLSAWRIGWDAKSEALREIAAELGIGIDSLIFVNNSPVEIAAVNSELPEVATVLMPADPTGWYEAMNGAAVLDRLPPTADDRKRVQRVSRDRQRRQLRTSVPPDVYLKELDIWASVRTAAPADLGRLSQMVLKINQMNLNGLRMTEPELRSLCADPGHRVRMIDAGDRFGDYGTVGAYLLTHADNSAELRLFVLSCRALGRGIEQVMLADAFAQAEEWGVNHVTATFRPTQRNKPALRLFPEIQEGSPAGPGPLRRIKGPSYVTVRQE